MASGTRFVLELVPATLGRIGVSVLIKDGQMRVNIRSERTDVLAALQGETRVLERQLEPHLARGNQALLEFELDHRGEGSHSHQEADEKARETRPGPEVRQNVVPDVPSAEAPRPGRPAMDRTISTIDVTL